MKKFYNDTLIGGAFSKALRVVALLCVLLGVSSSAWADNIYVTGDAFDGWGNWTQMTSIGDNKYTCVIKNSSGKFKLSSSEGYENTWNNLSCGDGSVTCNGANDHQINKAGILYFEWKDGGYVWVESVSNEIGFFTNEAWNIKIGEHWQTQSGYGATGNPAKISLNTTITSGTSIGFWAQTYKKGNTNVCSPRVYVKIEDESGKVIQDYKYYELPNSSTTTDNNTGSTNQLWLSDNVQTIPALTDGNYLLKVYFEMWGNKSGASGCNQYVMFLNNGGGNYVFPFTIAGGGTGDGGDDVEGCTTVYLNNELKLWDTTNNHAYIYHWGSSASSSWKVMLPSSCNNGGIWYASIPNDVAGYKFVLVDDVHGEPTWNDRIYQTQDLSLGNQHQYKITKVTLNSADAQGEYQAPTCTDKDPNCSGGGGGGGDVPDDPVLSDCDYIEVWCRYEDGKTNMHCYAWDADKNNLLGGWPGVTSNVTDTYEGKTYAIWKFSNVDNINIIFNNNSGSQTADITGHIKGNVYYYTLKNDWNYDQTHKKLDCSLEPTDVLLAREAYLDPATKEATVYGYLKATDCKDITDYGFYYCTTLDGATPCIPVANNNLKWSAIGSGNTPLPRGMEFSAKTGTLDAGLTYYYRAYAKVGEEIILSQEVRSITTEPCVAQTCCGDPVIYTVDATFTSDNPCKLYFRDVQKAIDHLKGSYASDQEFRYVTVEDGSYNLNQPVVINVRYHDDSPNDPSSAYLYRGTTSVGKRAGDAEPKNSNLIRDINKTATNRANTLTIKAGNSIAKPWLHHIVIRNSKNIVLDSLCIYSDPNGVGDNAIEMDINVADAGGGWNEAIAKGFFTDANILVQNCMIGSDGFTGAHLSNYDGVTFKNNDFEIVATDGTDPNWGASLKLLYCRNIKFIENNFRGDHATLMWIQEVENMLVMNNVFWNTNKFTVGANDQFPAAMRLVAQFGKPVDNIGIFYNTYYFAENDVVASGSGYDFLQFTHTIVNGSGNIDLNTIQFKYNNCYSYDKDAPGRSNNTNAFLGNDLSNNENFCPNNFWSEYDVINPPKDGKSAFAFGCGDNTLINVKGEVCATTASGPASLIISGDAMNLGVAPDVKFTGITLEADELLADRYLDGVRPSNGEDWTYGAYQQRESKDVEKIYWVGVSNKWDDRNNWEFETENNGKIVRQRVSCVESLSANLHVVIEEIGTVEVAGGRKWPRIPSSFDATDRENESKVKDGDIGVPEEEQVNAGNSGKYASYIELEYGAGIIGVENLVKTIDGNKVAYYDSVSTQFVSPRSEWILVGPTVKPFDTTTAVEDDVRNLLSGDYYIANQEPHVYMHQANISAEGQVGWDLTFADLKAPLTHDKVFAMQIPDEYGPFKLPAELHYAYISPNPSMVKDATVSKNYSFKGNFYNENSLPTYTGLNNGEWVLISNTYPANIDAYMLDESGLGKVQIYDYEAKSFGTLKAKASTPILSQHGFAFQPSGNNDLVIPVEYFLNTLTRRSATIVDPYCRINVKNITSNASSDVEIEIDELKEDVANYGTDASKVFNSMEASLPDMYIMRYDKKWAEVTVPTMSEAIPLGVRISQENTTIRFSYVDSEGLGDVILEDRIAGETYNLSIGQVCTVSDLPVGDCEGRFFLNLSEKDMEDNEDVEDDVTTDVEEETFTDSGITIIGNSNSVVVSCSTDMELQYIYINDMSGKTAMYKVSGNYVVIDMPVAQGVYTVNVIADKANKTGKVILK